MSSCISMEAVAALGIGNCGGSFLRSLPKGVRVTIRLADIDRFFAPAGQPVRDAERAPESDG